MRKCLWILGVLLLCASSVSGQAFTLGGSIHTNAVRDSITSVFRFYNGAATNDTTFDSVTFVRYRIDGTNDMVLVDNWKAAVGDTLAEDNYSRGLASIARRASDGSGTTGSYVVSAKGWKGSTYFQFGVESYTVFDSCPRTWTGTPCPIFATRSTDTVRSDNVKWRGTAIPATTTAGLPDVNTLYWGDGLTPVSWNVAGIPKTDMGYWKGTVPLDLVSQRPQVDLRAWRGIVPGVMSGTGADTLIHVSLEQFRRLVPGVQSGTGGDTLIHAAPDWANVKNPTATVGLTNTTVGIVSLLNALANNIITALSIQDGAIDSATLAADFYTKSLRSAHIALTDSTRGVGNGTITALGATLIAALLDSMSSKMDMGNLAPDPGFESRALGGPGWRQATPTAAIALSGTAGVKSGRKFLRLTGVSAKVVSDTLRLVSGQRIMIGGDAYQSALGQAKIILETVTGTEKVSVQPPTDQLWSRRYTFWTVDATTNYRIALTNGGAADTAFFDNIFLLPMVDSVSVGAVTAAIDSNVLWHVGQALWGIGAGQAGFDNVYINGDSLPVAKRTVTAPGAAGQGIWTSTVFVKDSTTGGALQGALLNVFTGGSFNAGPRSTAANGTTTFNLDNGTHIMRFVKTGYRKATNADTTIVVSGANTTDTLSLVGATQILPVVAGRCNFYGYIQDILGYVNRNVEIAIQFTGQGGNPIKCCVGDTTTVLAGDFYATTNPDSTGRWEFNLVPSARLIPATQYKIVIHLGQTKYMEKKVEVPDQPSELFQP